MPSKKKRNPAPPKAKSKEVEELETRLKKYEKLKADVTKDFEKCKEEWVRNDLEWLSLINLAKQANNAKNNNPIPKQTTDFKDVQQLNTTPISVKDAVTSLDKKEVQCKVEVESCDED